MIKKEVCICIKLSLHAVHVKSRNTGVRVTDAVCGISLASAVDIHINNSNSSISNPSVILSQLHT